jgi:hypothetical protein
MGKTPSVTNRVFCIVALLLSEPVLADNSQIADLYLKRLAAMGAITATFHQETSYTPSAEVLRDQPAIAAKLGIRFHLNTGLYIENGKFEFLESRALYDVEYAPETVQRLEAEKTPFIRHRIRSYSLDRAESFTKHSATGHEIGIIAEHADLPNEYPIDIGLGLRCGNDQQWLDDKTVKSSHFTSTGGRLISMMLEGTRRPGVAYLWELDPSLGYAVVHFQSKQGKAVLYDLKCTQFEDHDGISLPGMITALYPSGPSTVSETITVSGISYELHGLLNTPESYRVQFPSRSIVKDTRLGVAMQSPTTRAYSDRDIYLAAAARDAHGRALPSQSALTKWWVGAGVLFLAGTVVYVYRRTRRNDM